MSLRKLGLQGAALLRRHGAVENIVSNSCRNISSLPKDIADAARKARFPAKRPAGTGTPAAAAEASATPAAVAAPLNVQQEGAKIATNWMFPWERRQMQGGALKPWEKLYWGVFVVAISLVLFNRLREPSKQVDPAAEENRKRKELAKAERARLVLAGGSVIEGEEDPFDGLAPEEIQRYVEEATGANAEDPFEGMSPEEINEYLAQHGVAAGRQ